jgi:hypothetical protein
MLFGRTANYSFLKKFKFVAVSIYKFKDIKMSTSFKPRWLGFVDEGLARDL